MGKINWSRVFLGGLLWWIVYGVLVAVEIPNIIVPLWEADLGRPFRVPTGVLVFGSVIMFLLGIFTIWLYAAIRPRYGPGPKTAIIAGLAAWFGGSAPLIAFNAFGGWLSARFMAIDASINLVEVVVATLVGAWVYKEEEGVEAAAPSPATPEE